MIHHLITQFAATTCPGGSFLGFPPWYKYLPGSVDTVTHSCTPQLNSLSAVWLIVAAGIEILLRVAALAAVGFIMYGGFLYLTSQGDPGKAAQARTAILSAVAGLVVAIMAAVVVGFIAGSIK